MYADEISEREYEYIGRIEELENALSEAESELYYMKRQIKILTDILREVLENLREAYYDEKPPSAEILDTLEDVVTELEKISKEKTY